jgi:hypothetical protein
MHPWWFDVKLEANFSTAIEASKNKACFQSGQNRLKNNHLAILIYIRETHSRKAQPANTTNITQFTSLKWLRAINEKCLTLKFALNMNSDLKALVTGMHNGNISVCACIYECVCAYIYEGVCACIYECVCV